MSKREQTWHLLSEALLEIKYTRDEPPAGYKRFELEEHLDENYAALFIYTFNPNTYRPGEMRFTRHEFIVPVTTYHKAAWTRWVFDRILSIEAHETTECFQVADYDACPHCGKYDEVAGEGDHSCSCPDPETRCGHGFIWYRRIYGPHHGNGWDPYTIWYDGHPDEQAKAPGEN